MIWYLVCAFTDAHKPVCTLDTTGIELDILFIPVEQVLAPLWDMDYYLIVHFLRSATYLDYGCLFQKS